MGIFYFNFNFSFIVTNNFYSLLKYYSIKIVILLFFIQRSKLICVFFSIRNPVHFSQNQPWPTQIDSRTNFRQIVMLGARIWTFLKFSRFSSKTAIIKRLEKGRGLAMTEPKNWDEQMMKFSTKSDALKSARTRSLWGKNWAKSDSKKAVKNLKFDVFIRSSRTV
jgi:hypothetical protein